MIEGKMKWAIDTGAHDFFTGMFFGFRVRQRRAMEGFFAARVELFQCVLSNRSLACIDRG